MSKPDTTPTPTPKVKSPPALNEQAVTFLTQECERMLALYSQAQANAQSVFNFYLTFITAIGGAIIFMIQADLPALELWLIAVLFFTGTVGSVYLSALSGRYAHSNRYAYTVDELRLYLIERLQIPVPAAYETFVSRQIRTPHRATLKFIYWLMPTGTYQMFMGLVNSTALTAMMLIIFIAADALGIRAVLACLITLLLTFTFSNVFSRLTILRFRGKANIDLWNDSPAWASRE